MRIVNALYSSHDPFGIAKDDWVITIHHASQLKKGDVLILHGGEDISPSLYNKKLSLCINCNAPQQPSKRDIIEKLMFERAVELGIPIIGICRGAQLLCALSGGSLHQHLVGHPGGSHAVKDIYGSTYITNSAHHQAMDLPEDGAVLIAWQEKECHAYGESDIPYYLKNVPEVVYFPTVNALGIQGHPEWSPVKSPFNQHCKSYIEEYLL